MLRVYRAAARAESAAALGEQPLSQLAVGFCLCTAAVTTKCAEAVRHCDAASARKGSRGRFLRAKPVRNPRRVWPNDGTQGVSCDAASGDKTRLAAHGELYLLSVAFLRQVRRSSDRTQRKRGAAVPTQ